MPAATESTTEARPELVSKVPEKIAKKRDGDTVYSKSRRQNLGGAVTTVYLTPEGQFRVEGPAGEDWGTHTKFTGKGQALDVARNGPSAEEPEAEGDEAQAEEPAS